MRLKSKEETSLRPSLPFQEQYLLPLRISKANQLTHQFQQSFFSTRGLDTIAKQSDTRLIDLNSLDISLITETLWTGKESCSILACSKLLQETILKMIHVKVLPFSAGYRVKFLQ